MSDEGYEKVTVKRGDDGIPRDQWGRYRLPDPVTGKVKSWTRATTIAGMLKDRFGLEKWDQRNIVWGLGQRPSLWAQAAACKREDDRTLQQIADKAKDAADSYSGADVGSALHTFTERIDRGEDVAVPAPFDRDVAAYRAAMEANRIVPASGWIERVVVVPEIGVAGTIDRLVDGPWPLPRIGDLKTAKDKTYDRWDEETGRRAGPRVVNTILAYGSTDIPLQLAIYAHATHWWTGEDWKEMPKVDQERAVVMHLPAGQATCRLYEVDIAAGWDAVGVAYDIRDWRKRKGLITTIPGPEASEPPTAAVPPAETNVIFEARLEWLRERVEAIKVADVERDGLTPRRRLATIWSQHDDIPTFPKGGPRDDNEIDVIAGACELVEMEFELAFGVSDPAGPAPTAGSAKGK